MDSSVFNILRCRNLAQRCIKYLEKILECAAFSPASRSWRKSDNTIHLFLFCSRVRRVSVSHHILWPLVLLRMAHNTFHSGRCYSDQQRKNKVRPCYIGRWNVCCIYASFAITKLAGQRNPDQQHIKSHYGNCWIIRIM